MKLEILLAAILLSFVAKAQAPEQDCINAIDVCQSVNSYGTWGIVGGGNIPDEINEINSCLGAGEENVVWFRVYTTQPGILNFTIKPYDSTVDYNWAVFNLTQANCADIYNNPSLEVSCNSSTSVTNSGHTGPNGGVEPQDEQDILVGDAEWYYIAVSCVSITTTGFIIDFNGSTSLGGSNPLQFVNQSPPNLAPANRLFVYFNQPVRCASMTATDFRLYDINNQNIPITSLDDPLCINPSDLVSSCVLFLSADLIEGMPYKLTKVGNIQKRCLQVDTAYAELQFVAPPAANPIISYENKPEQDCITAMPVCSANMSINGSYSGQGLVINELNNNESCLGLGELNNIWFRIPIESDGNLNFTIRPTDYNADFDWVVYNLTNASCSDIYNNSALESSCNFSGSTYPMGITGANGGYNSQENPVIPVLAGQVYYLLVSNFLGDVSGFQLDMSNSTCGIAYQFDETFSDGFTPQYFPPNNLQVLFNSYILCNSVQTTDFALYNTHTGFEYIISNVEPFLCDGPGDSTANKFQLTFSPPLTTNNSYKVVRTGQVQNICGLQSTASDSIAFIAVITGVDVVVPPAFTANTLTNNNILVSNQFPLTGTLSIYNLAGMLMQSTRVENSTSIQLDISSCPEGLYILNYTNTYGQSYSTKVVKVNN